MSQLNQEPPSGGFLFSVPICINLNVEDKFSQEGWGKVYITGIAILFKRI
jgi:hypothetical protein